ncbi:DUF397 domain-containing protein [Actinacidiphila acidipaludis]|uniref:DUF397 domain-containing protein n=1 Tax=Actinacidiphila acidipaludis TaxID=2873382 RepID=A0ABS7QI71_9ACTN|nr:DUF397 domain-containing protein [Streptomyces acidipaludis]MBY8882663.1 DUF397 domain-containing protein [Streptomyces acidipaludis]
MAVIPDGPSPYLEDSVSESTFDGAFWFKATGSGEAGCVEVAVTPTVIGVRDTKDNGNGPILSFGRQAWTSFVQDLHHDDFVPEWLSL